MLNYRSNRVMRASGNGSLSGRPLLGTGAPTPGVSTQFLSGYSAQSFSENSQEASFDQKKEHENRYAIGGADLFHPTNFNLPLPLKILVCVLLSPFIGTFWCYFAAKEHLADRMFGNNQQDYLVMIFAGATHQLSLICVLFNFHDAEARYTANKLDFVGTLALYPATCAWLLGISLVFKYKKQLVESKEEQKKGLHIHREFDKVSDWIEKFRGSTEIRSALIIPYSLIVGFGMMFAVRTCYSAESHVGNCNGRSTGDLFYQATNPSPSPVASDSSVDGGEGLDDGDLYFVIISFFWWLITSSSVAISTYAASMYFQQMRQVEEFTYIQQYAKTKPFLKDLQNDFSSDIAVWNLVWNELLTQLNERPFMRALVSCSIVTSAIMWIVCLFYIGINNVMNTSHVAPGTIATSVLALYSVCMLIFFVGVTVKVSRIIEHQVSSISAAQNELQRELEEKKYDMDVVKLFQMTSSCQVLSHLDSYLQVNSNRSPQLVGGVTLEGVRWITIISSLLSLNVFFFALYGHACYEEV